MNNPSKDNQVYPSSTIRTSILPATQAGMPYIPTKLKENTMQQPIQITFRSIDHSDAIESAIRSKAEKLEALFDDIISCQAVIEAPHKHHHKGRHYQVKLSIAVPGKELIVKRAPDKHDAHEDPYVAIRDAFEAARRQLKEYVDKIKRHDVSQEARDNLVQQTTTIM